MEDILLQGLAKIVNKFPEEADFNVQYYNNNTNSLKTVSDENFRN